MPRVKQVTAAKDYPHFGIKKGDKHYTWSLKTGPRSSREFRQIAPPKPAQLTSSEFLQSFYGMEEEIDTFVHDDDLPGTLEEFAGRVTELADEQQEKFDNLSDGFQQGSTGQTLEERADGLTSWASEIEEAASTLTEKIEEISGKEWHELDDFSDRDPEDEDFDAETDTPDEEEIESARMSEKAEAFEEAISAVRDSIPSF